MKKIFYVFFAILTFLTVTNCTDNFEDYNKNPYGADNEDLGKVPQGGNQLIDLQKLVLPQQENSYQMCFDLFATVYSGYATQPKFRKDYTTYNPREGWVNYPFTDTYPKIYAPYFKLESLAKGDKSKMYLAWGTVLKVGITQWLTDTYGPLPYSKMEEGKQTVVYDSQKDLYLKMCEDLKTSIEALKKVDPSDREYAPFDLVYGGDFTLWVKYANSLLLRIATRMSDVLPEEAKTYGEYALQNGVIVSNAENATLATNDNPAYKVSAIWNDSRAGADITSYMNAFSDPRREKYFTPVSNRDAQNKFFGLRSGAPSVDIDPSNYSLPNVSADSPIVWISAAEVAFLKAEAALKGWNVGGTAKELYEEGIKLSFEQWSVSIGNYLENSDQRGDFTDDLAPGFNTSFSSNITVNWNDAAGDKEKELAKIITQKWIAMYPYGSQEGWAEWRRTGYPNLLPAKVNQSGGKVQNITQENGKDVGGMRRLSYPISEFTNNRTNVKDAISNFLSGPDNGGTNLWWVKQ